MLLGGCWEMVGLMLVAFMVLVVMPGMVMGRTVMVWFGTVVPGIMEGPAMVRGMIDAGDKMLLMMMVVIMEVMKDNDHVGDDGENSHVDSVMI